MTEGNWIALIGLAFTIVVTVCSFIFFFMKRELARLDKLPVAMRRLSKAIESLNNWRLNYTNKNDAEIREIKQTIKQLKRRLKRLEHNDQTI